MRLLVLSALFLPSLLAQALPDADVLIKEQAAAMKSHRSLQHVSETTMEMTGPMPMKMTGQVSVAYRNPGRMRMEVNMQGMTMTMVSDGESTIAYNSMTKQYVRQAAALGPEGIAAMMVGTQNMPDVSKMSITAKTLGEETIEMDGQKHDCWVVEQRVGKMEIPSVQGAVVSDMVMTDWLDKKLGIDLQRIVSMKMQLPGGGDAMGMTQRVVKKSLKLDEPIADSFFAFTPPADAKEVPTLMGTALPKGDLAGKEAPAFEVQSLEASSYSLAGLKGKPVLLDFWATWCGPCRKSMPVVEKLFREYKDQGLIVLSVDAGEDRATVEEFLKKTPMPYPVVLGGDSGITAAYGVAAFPTFVMIGRDGKVVAHEIGFGGEAALRGMARKAGLTEATDKDK